jgi:hypothetical protein
VSLNHTSGCKNIERHDSKGIILDEREMKMRIKGLLEEAAHENAQRHR